MKFGPRKPSLKRSVKARTTGRLKRNIKKSVNPLYGKKGMGWVNNPKKAAYNKVYNKTTFSMVPKPNRSNRTQPKKTLKSSKIELKQNKDNFFVLDEKKVKRKKWNYWWCLAVFLLFVADVSVALIMTSIAFLIIRHHNKKPVEEIKQVRKKLSDQEIAELLVDIESLSERLENNVNILNNTSVPRSYFEALSELNEIVPSANYLINHYHLPVDFDFGTKIDGETDDREVNEFQSVFDEATEHFIRQYHRSCEESAQKLKTENGFNNRMNKNKEELLIYKEYLNNANLELIEKLWSETKYL